MDKLNRPVRIHFVDNKEALDLIIKMELKYFIMQLLYYSKIRKQNPIMGIFKNLTKEEVVSLHVMIHFLRRLGCCGKVFTTTVSADHNVPVSAISFADRDYKKLRYSIRYDGYDPSRYEMQVELELEKIFECKMRVDPWTTHFKF